MTTKTYRQVRNPDGTLGLVDTTDWKRPPRKAPYVRGDLPDYMPMGGPEAQKFFAGDPSAKMIGGKKDHREYLKRNDFVEVGNEKKPFVEFGGKTKENYDHWNNRVYRGIKVEPAKGAWVTPDLDRLDRK